MENSYLVNKIELRRVLINLHRRIHFDFHRVFPFLLFKVAPIQNLSRPLRCRPHRTLPLHLHLSITHFRSRIKTPTNQAGFRAQSSTYPHRCHSGHRHPAPVKIRVRQKLQHNHHLAGAAHLALPKRSRSREATYSIPYQPARSLDSSLYSLSSNHLLSRSNLQATSSTKIIVLHCLGPILYLIERHLRPKFKINRPRLLIFRLQLPKSSKRFQIHSDSKRCPHFNLSP